MSSKRSFRILWFFGKAILSFIFWELFIAKIGFAAQVRKRRPAQWRSLARSFRVMAVQMGGVMIKVGQFLSSRVDVLPHELTDELAGLQDEVAPESFDSIRAVIEKESGMSLEQRFYSFEQKPMAAASIGQVHSARLSEDGEEVVVKVQRPNIEKIVEIDLAALRIVGGWLDQYKPIHKRANVPAMLDEFSQSLMEEIDYLNEGKNAETFAENFKEDERVRVPKVIWSHSSRRVLVLENVQAIKIADNAALDEAGISRMDVANGLLDIYLQQVFEDRFFHADPHPGNLFVLPLGEKVEGQKREWKLTFVDFGMTGQVADNIFTGLREALIAIGTQDPPRLISAYVTMGVLLPGADLDLLNQASQRVFERFWGKSTTEIMGMHTEEARAFLHEFGDLIYEMPFQIPENLILLGRCVGILSGICTGLETEFNFWNVLAPYARKLVEADGKSSFSVVMDEVKNLLTTLLTLPRKTDALITKIEQGKLEFRSSELKIQIARLESSQRRVAAAVVFAAFLLTASQFYLAAQMIPAAVLGGAALISLGFVVGGRRNSG